MAALTSSPPQGLSSPRFSARLKEGRKKWGSVCLHPGSRLRALASPVAESGPGKRSEPHPVARQEGPGLPSVLAGQTPRHEASGEPLLSWSTLRSKRLRLLPLPLLFSNLSCDPL